MCYRLDYNDAHRNDHVVTSESLDVDYTIQVDISDIILPATLALIDNQTQTLETYDRYYFTAGNLNLVSVGRLFLVLEANGVSFHDLQRYAPRTNPRRAG